MQSKYQILDQYEYRKEIRKFLKKSGEIWGKYQTVILDTDFVCKSQYFFIKIDTDFVVKSQYFSEK